MARRGLTSCSLIWAAMAAVSLGIQAQGAAPGDLEGLWNDATMTPLERPRDLAAKASLDPAEAAEYERLTIERQGAANNTAGRIYECACHEGNARSMIGMLRGARAQEKPDER